MVVRRRGPQAWSAGGVRRRVRRQDPRARLGLQARFAVEVNISIGGFRTLGTSVLPSKKLVDVVLVLRDAPCAAPSW